MKPHDLRLLCTALGFTAIITRDGQAGKKRVMDFAKLIEDFCHETVPEAFEATNGNESDSKGNMPEFSAPESSTSESQENFAIRQRIADAIVEIYAEQNGCLPQDLIAKGFTPEEVEKHWAFAMGLAKSKMNMSDS